MEAQHEQRRIGSHLHQLYTLQYNKKTLSFFEDKRCWISRNESLPYGNFKLVENTDAPPPTKKRRV